MVALPVLPSLIAVITAEPGAAAVMTPLTEMVVTLALLVVHATGRPVSGLPAESFVVAAGVTATDATGAFMVVTLAVPFCPSLVAVMVAAPGVTAVAAPLGEMVTMLASLVAHCTARPVTVSPAASVVIASIWRDAPT